MDLRSEIIMKTELFNSKKDVIQWFGNRGIRLSQRRLKAWYWESHRLFYIVTGDKYGESDLPDTQNGCVDVTLTDSGSFEPYDKISLLNDDLAAVAARWFDTREDEL